MSEPPWILRSARDTKRDRALLESFSCADPARAWQTEVEVHIRTQLHQWTFDPFAQDSDPRLLLLFDRATKKLVALAAHERTILAHPGGETVAATKLEVVAVTRTWQGRTFTAGVRASDVIMSAVMRDVASRVPPRDARVFAVVHDDNVQSLRLCRRHGLVEEMSRPMPGYRRLVTAARR